jgi:hypothetical protein
VSRPERLCRLLLLAYPRSFRAAYGDEIVTVVHDLRRHAGMSRRRVALHLFGDVLVTAPRMRWEGLMKNSKLLAVAALAVLALFALAVGSPVFVPLVLVPVALAAVLARRHDRPLVNDVCSTAQWYRWLLAGGVAFGAGFLTLVIEGDDELSEAGWAIWFSTWILGAVLVVFGIVLGMSHLVARPRSSNRGT